MLLPARGVGFVWRTQRLNESIVQGRRAHVLFRSVFHVRELGPQANTSFLRPNRHTHTHARLTALFLVLPRSSGTRNVKPIWILVKQETVSGSGISWAICKSTPCSRQHPTTQFFTGWMPFLPLNQQRQSTEGTDPTEYTAKQLTHDRFDSFCRVHTH